MSMTPGELIELANQLLIVAGRIPGVITVTGPPANTLGAVGSSAFWAEERTWYGPKTAEGWPPGVVVTEGPQGLSAKQIVINAGLLPPGATDAQFATWLADSQIDKVQPLVDAAETARDEAQQALTDTETLADQIIEDSTPDITVTAVAGAPGTPASVVKGGTLKAPTFEVTVPRGADGEEVGLRKSATHVQWRLGDGAWTNLVALAELTGADGREVQLQASATHIQWRYVGETAWTNIVALSAFTGPQGNAAWSPIYANVADGTRRVQRLVDWTGGQGTKPATGKYLGPAGLVDTAAEATDIRGASGPGTGDMQAENNLADLTDKAAARVNLGVIAAESVDSSQNVASRIAEMSAVRGFVRFADGQIALNADAIMAAAVFEGGASIFIPAGVTLTVNGAINAPRQQLFYGPGSVVLNEDASHVVLPEWFGLVPGKPNVDSGPILQKISDSVLPNRQCLIEFAAGVYYVQTPVTWSRSCKLKGAGDRLTHFRSSWTAGDIFSCAGPGVQFEDIQFSCTAKRSSGAYINLNGQYSAARRIWFTDGFEGVAINSGQCRVHEVTGSVWSNAVDSALVAWKSGDDADIDRIQSLSNGTDAPYRVVSVKPSAAAIRYGDVSRVRQVASGRAAVEVDADGHDVEYVSISTVKARGAGSAVIIRSGVGNLRSCGLDGIEANAVSGDGIVLTKSGAGAFTSVTIGRHDLRATNDGLRVEAATGAVQGVSIGAGVARNCGSNGYNIKAVGLVASGIQARSNLGTGILLPPGAASYRVVGVSEFNGTNASHPSEANSIMDVVTP